MCLCTFVYTSPICESRLLESTYTLFNRLNGIKPKFKLKNQKLKKILPQWRLRLIQKQLQRQRRL
jgi:hypothetical protein